MQGLFDIQGRKAIVTGGGGQIGTAMVEALAAHGAAVALISRSDKVDRLAERLGAGETKLYAVHADFNERASLRQGFQQAVEQLGGLDILINCHGYVKAGDSLDYPADQWDQNIEVNLNSVFFLCQLAGSIMVPQGHGKIVNVASMLSFGGGFRAAAYAASKGGVAQLTKALANEWASKGVNVNALAPGYIQTELNQHIWKDPVRNEQILARLPVGRWGKPSDLQGVTIFLCAPASDYVHGTVLPVDGGWLSR